MPKCKMSICQAEAVPGAPKRYCSYHLSEYKRKQQERDMSDLDKLIEAVEAGTFLMDALPDERLAHEAFNGSLDAAMRLHEALLPGWSWGRWSNGHMWVTDDIDDADRFVTSGGYFQDIFARAWLLAVLRALRDKDTP